MSFEIVAMGLLAGFLVGLTGVGGATLITPFLVLMGISPITAVGTDLIYNSITKLFGFIHHARQKAVKCLAYGSIPGTVIAVLFMKWNEAFYNNRNM